MYAYNNYINNVTYHPVEEIPTNSKIGEAFAVIFPSSPVLSSSVSTRGQHCLEKGFYHSCFSTFCVLQTFLLSFARFAQHTHAHPAILYFLSDQVIFCQFRFVKFIISTHVALVYPSSPLYSIMWIYHKLVIHFPLTIFQVVSRISESVTVVL